MGKGLFNMESVVKGRFGLLLIAFALLFFAGPLLVLNMPVLDKAFSILSLLVLLSCLRSITENRRFFYFMVVLSLLNLSAGIPAILVGSSPDWLLQTVLWLRLLYLLLVVGSIMRYILDRRPVTADKIFGALSAYLLLGLLWATVYALFDLLLPGSFSLPDGLQAGRQALPAWSIYFSYTTLTTLGYGDITPTLPAAQSFAFMEAACGQIFLAVLVARLVALHIVHSGSPTEAGDVHEPRLDQA